MSKPAGKANFSDLLAYPPKHAFGLAYACAYRNTGKDIAMTTEFDIKSIELGPKQKTDSAWIWIIGGIILILILA